MIFMLVRAKVEFGDRVPELSALGNIELKVCGQGLDARMKVD